MRRVCIDLLLAPKHETGVLSRRTSRGFVNYLCLFRKCEFLLVAPHSAFLMCKSSRSPPTSYSNRLSASAFTLSARLSAITLFSLALLSGVPAVHLTCFHSITVHLARKGRGGSVSKATSRLLSSYEGAHQMKRAYRSVGDLREPLSPA